MLAVVLGLLVSFSFAQSNYERVQNLKTVTRIAFGSCNDQNDAQPLWKDLIAQKPDLWIWGGDIIYADWNKSESVRKAYEKLNNHPDYAAFRAQTPMIGTWDDHDYAFNDAGGNVSFKKLSQQYFLDFFEEPETSERRQREGVYHSYEFGEAEQKVKIILLDNRYFKGLEANYSMLGKTQWDWLENEFKNSTAKLHLIVTGLSIFSPKIPYTEEWRERPSEINRMVSLIRKYKVSAPLFLTGDKHFSAIFKGSGQLEFLSSGMTHNVSKKAWWYLKRKYPATYFGLAYGRLDLAWENNLPVVTMFMRNGSRDIHKRTVVWKKNSWIRK